MGERVKDKKTERRAESDEWEAEGVIYKLGEGCWWSRKRGTGTVWMTVWKPDGKKEMRGWEWFLRHTDSGRDKRRENSGRGGIRSHEEGGEPAQGGGTTLRIETYPTLPLSLVAQQAGRKGPWCVVVWSWRGAGPGTKEQRRRAPGAVRQGCPDTATQGWHVVFVSVMRFQPDTHEHTHTHTHRDSEMARSHLHPHHCLSLYEPACSRGIR